MPRMRPSVVAIDTQRTRSLPRCAATSSTTSMLRAGSFTESAWLMGGSFSGNATSTTTPMICAIVPTFFVEAGAVVATVKSHFFRREIHECVRTSVAVSSQRLGAAHDLHELLGDRVLTYAVIGDRKSTRLNS